MDEEQIARNETTYRRLNESIEQHRVTRRGLVGFLCECGQLGCNEVVELLLEEYEAVRADPRRFVVAPGHVANQDREVEARPRFSTVEKVGSFGVQAERDDPRRTA